VSPVSRGRKKKNKSTSKTTPRDVFGDVLRRFRPLLEEEDPLNAEMATSQLLSRAEPGFVADVTAYAARKATPVALAMLRVLQMLARAEDERSSARSAAELVAARGTSEPPWWGALESVTLVQSVQIADIYGDEVTVVLLFARSGKQHALAFVIDFNLVGQPVVEILLPPDAAGHLDDLREECASSDVLELAEISPQRARRLIENGLRAPDLEVDTSGIAFALARLRLMPPPEPAPVPREYSAAEREAIVSEFFAEADGVVDTEFNRAYIRAIVDFGCDDDSGRPLRIGPGKLETLFAEVVPPADDDVAPDVLRAWVRWAGTKSELPEPAIVGLLAALDESFEVDADLPLDAYLDGVEPDADSLEVEAVLERRLFAMPDYTAEILGEELGALDPASPEDRHLLLVGEYPEYQEALDDPSSEVIIDGVNPRLFISIREIVVNQLWDNTPPETWEAARRLIEAGHDRKTILSGIAHVLSPHIYRTLKGENFDENAYRAQLRKL
jgi:hypothetical protein